MKLAMIPIDLIDEDERIRKEYGNIQELATNIAKRGLIQPLAVMAKNNRYLLLAGGRRLRALKHNKAEEVAVRIYEEELSELEKKSIELHENFYRKDLEWLEQVTIQRQIHELQQAIHGIKVSTSPDASGWSAKDTAELVGRSKSSVVQDIQLAEAAEKFPELFSACRNKHDASKVLNKLGETIVRDELARRAEERKLSINSQKLADSFINRDFFLGIRQVPDSTVNFVELDPPYAINLTQIKQGMHESSSFDTKESYNEIDSEKYLLFMKQVLKECYRVMTEHSWLICWFGPDPWFDPLYNLLTETGFNTTRLISLWIKQGPGQTHWPARRLGANYEMFYYASKGQPTLAKQGRPNTFEFPAVPPKQKIHPTERPIELIREILSTFTFPGSRILVPFLGSGNTLLAAYSLGMNAFGFELSKQYRDSFLVRLTSKEQTD